MACVLLVDIITPPRLPPPNSLFRVTFSRLLLLSSAAAFICRCFHLLLLSSVAALICGFSHLLLLSSVAALRWFSYAVPTGAGFPRRSGEGGGGTGSGAPSSIVLRHDGRYSVRALLRFGPRLFGPCIFHSRGSISVTSGSGGIYVLIINIVAHVNVGCVGEYRSREPTRRLLAFSSAPLDGVSLALVVCYSKRRSHPTPTW